MGMSRTVTEDSLTYYLTGESVLPRPTAWEMSLHTGAPGVDGLDNEVEDAAYERQGITFEVDYTATGDPFAQNDGMVVFPLADSGYTVTHIALWSDAGTLIVTQPLRTPKVIATAEQAQVAPGEIKIGAL